MKNRFIVCFMLIISFYQISYSQNHEDIKKYELLAMLSLFSEGLNNSEVEVNEETLNKFLSENLEISIIEQNSFKDFAFISINPEKNRRNSGDVKMPIIWSSNDCEEYILAINKGSLYTFKLKGYQLNDFNSFLNFLVKNGYKKINGSKSFSKNYEVSGLDFDCLYSSLNVKSKNDFEKFPCLRDTCLKIYKTHN